MLLAQLALMKCRVPQFWYDTVKNFRPWRSPASVGKILKFFGVLQIFTTVLSIWLDWPGWVVTNKQCLPQCNSLWICQSLIAQWSEHLLRLQKVKGYSPPWASQHRLITDYHPEKYPHNIHSGENCIVFIKSSHFHTKNLSKHSYCLVKADLQVQMLFVS